MLSVAFRSSQPFVHLFIHQLRIRASSVHRAYVVYVPITHGAERNATRLYYR